MSDPSTYGDWGPLISENARGFADSVQQAGLELARLLDRGDLNTAAISDLNEKLDIVSEKIEALNKKLDDFAATLSSVFELLKTTNEADH